MWYLWTKNIKGVTVKVEILDKGQSDPALEKTTKQLFLSVARFMMEVTSKYFDSREPENHVTFNSSQ